MAGGVGHTGGLTNPRPGRGRCRAGYSNTGGPPLPRKRAPLQKKKSINLYIVSNQRLRQSRRCMACILVACLILGGYKRILSLSRFEWWL